MPKKIHVLPEDITKCIAAGEVIERPGSVVKELMENSIDARSSQITVELKSAGLELIRVIDDGEGMYPEDVPIAIQRHATSKIKTFEDLYSVRTLGFRGEALPSIAAVSQMTIMSKISEAIAGIKVICEGGEIRYINEVGSPVGTEVQVKNLFYNVPVKRKFLKSLKSEFRNVVQQFLRLIISHPSISFKLIHDGRVVGDYPKTESLLVRIEAVMGEEVYENLKKIEYKNEEIGITGFISLPVISKSTSDWIYIYANNRFIKDRLILKAITEAYRNFIEKGKYPIVIVFINLPPSNIDANVHPTKIEVKFRNPEKIFNSVFSAIQLGLEEDLKRSSPFYEIDGSEKLFFPKLEEGNYVIRESLKPYTENLEIFRQKEGEERLKRFGILGQIKGTYIICEGDEDLIFIDQHAAHERIIFEKLKEDYKNHAIIKEYLLIPIQLELSLEESYVLNLIKDNLSELGFEIEQIGEKLYTINSIPSFIKLIKAKEMVKKIIEELLHSDLNGRNKEFIHEILTTISCHSAIKGNSLLMKEEMEELLNNLSSFDSKTTCPHGRPIFFYYPIDELHKEFKRPRGRG